MMVLVDRKPDGFQDEIILDIKKFTKEWKRDEPKLETLSVADLRGGLRDARPPPPLGVQILSISCSFGRIRQNCVFTPPLGGFTPPSLGEILDPSLLVLTYFLISGQISSWNPSVFLSKSTIHFSTNTHCKIKNHHNTVQS